MISFKSLYFHSRVITILFFAVFFTTKQTTAQTSNSMLYKFVPNWKHGMEMTFYHQKTSLGTNEKDMPLYMIVDTLYTVINVTETDSNTWILAIEHFTKYDAISRTAYLNCRESLKNAPIILEFDTSYNYLGLVNWEQWRDTLHKNLRIEFDKKQISLKTYSDYKVIYNEPEQVEEVVVAYYLDMFSIFGRSVDIWNKNPMVVTIKNPFTESSISKAGEEFFYIQTETSHLMRRSFTARTDETFYQQLAEDYINYINPNKDEDINFPKPRVILKRDEFHSFNINTNFLVEYRNETGVEINGASTLLEYHITLLNTRLP